MKFHCGGVNDQVDISGRGTMHEKASPTGLLRDRQKGEIFKGAIPSGLKQNLRNSRAARDPVVARNKT